MSCPKSISKTSDLSTSTKYISPNCLNIGSTGLNGLDGENGVPGMSINGPIGIIGPTGAVIDGQTGPIGPNGFNGTNGTNGLRGPTGNYGNLIPSMNINEGTIITATIINPLYSSTITKIGSITLSTPALYHILAQYSLNISSSDYYVGPVLVLGISNNDNATLADFANIGMSNTMSSTKYQAMYCQCSGTCSIIDPLTTVYVYAYFSFWSNLNFTATIISGSIQSIQIYFLIT